jgi:hypothetical protein
MTYDDAWLMYDDALWSLMITMMIDTSDFKIIISYFIKFQLFPPEIQSLQQRSALHRWLDLVAAGIAGIVVAADGIVAVGAVEFAVFAAAKVVAAEWLAVALAAQEDSCMSYYYYTCVCLTLLHITLTYRTSPSDIPWNFSFPHPPRTSSLQPRFGFCHFRSTCISMSRP